jgi:hypothetical protein
MHVDLGADADLSQKFGDVKQKARRRGDAEGSVR